MKKGFHFFIQKGDPSNGWGIFQKANSFDRENHVYTEEKEHVYTEEKITSVQSESANHDLKPEHIDESA